MDQELASSTFIAMRKCTIKTYHAWTATSEAIYVIGKAFKKYMNVVTARLRLEDIESTSFGNHRFV